MPKYGVSLELEFEVEIIMLDDEYYRLDEILEMIKRIPSVKSVRTEGGIDELD